MSKLLRQRVMNKAAEEEAAAQNKKNTSTFSPHSTEESIDQSKEAMSSTSRTRTRSSSQSPLEKTEVVASHAMRASGARNSISIYKGQATLRSPTARKGAKRVLPTTPVSTPAKSVHSSGKKAKHTPTTTNAPSTPPSHQQPNSTTKTPTSAASTSSSPSFSAKASSSQPSPSSTNVYDAVLGEAHDLLAAAAEAQALGRLKMASAYQLLLHARLVGLGKRFDRAAPLLLRRSIVASEKSSNTRSAAAMDAEDVAILANSTESTATSNEREKSSTYTHDSHTNCSSSRTNTIVNTDTNGSSLLSSPCSATVTAQAAALAKFIPSDIELDNTMMEHLARAAMELHNKRTGRGKLHHHHQGSVFSSVTSAGGGVAWTQDEKTTCLKAASKYGKESVEEISKAMGGRKSESQIRAHLRNVMGRERVERDLLVAAENANTASKKEFDEEDEEASYNDLDVERMKSDEEDQLHVKKEDWKEDGYNSYAETSMHGTVSDSATPTAAKRRGGRGKKPPTRAVHTVPNANFDARSLLLGSLSSLGS